MSSIFTHVSSRISSCRHILQKASKSCSNILLSRILSVVKLMCCEQAERGFQSG
ncbi:hypothetical protein B0O80DRAFT_454698 [Mortierella sp. GBAus27b]|nr:hypothetical protein B0O80DRAFT_454698 [Mortierella sp. GBAus27b]